MPDIEVSPGLIDSLGRLGPALPVILIFLFAVIARKEVFAFLIALRTDNAANAALGQIAALLIEIRTLTNEQNEKFGENMTMFRELNQFMGALGKVFDGILATQREMLTELRAILAALTSGVKR